MNALNAHLTAGMKFTIQVKPRKGAVLTFERITPNVIVGAMNLH